MKTCERCGLRYSEAHQCPEPLDRDVAESLLVFHGSTGLPMNPKTMAAIRVTLGFPQADTSD